MNDQALTLFNHIFDGLEGHLCLFTADRENSPDGPGDDLTHPLSRYFPYPSEVEAAVRHADEESEVGREVYFCAHLLTEAKRAKENVSFIRSFWADGDLAKFEGFSVSPTAVVESSPGRYHYYLRGEVPLLPEVAIPVNQRMTYGIGADKGGWGPTKLLRVPGTRNYKYDPPQPVVLSNLEARTYSLAEVEAAFPSKTEAPKRPPRILRLVPATDGQPPVVLPHWAMKVWEGMDHCTTETGELDRSRSLFQLAAVLLKHGASPDDTMAAIAERDSALGWAKYTERGDAEARYEDIVNNAASSIDSVPAELDDQVGREALQRLRDAREPLSELQEFYDNKDTLSAIAKLCLDEPAVLEGALTAVGKRLTVADKNAFRKALKTEQDRMKAAVANVANANLTLVESDCPGAPGPAGLVVPAGWDISAGGVRIAGSAIPFASAPVLIGARGKELATGAEFVTLSWHRDNSWQKRTVERGIVADRTKIVGLAAYGFPVHSGNSSDMVRYLSAFEAVNAQLLEPHALTRRFGWHAEAKAFVWGDLTLTGAGSTISIEFDGSNGGDDQLAAGMVAVGSYEGWLAVINLVSAAPRAMVALYASLASLLVHLMGLPNFIVNYSNATSTGKTTVLRVAASVYGKATDEGGDRFMGSWDQTRVAMERRASTLSHLPLILDDTKRAKDTRQIAQFIYDHADGVGKGRGAIEGLRATSSWNSIMISSGEAPLTSFSEDGGSRARVLEIWGPPLEGIDDPGAIANQVREALVQNYGHAGPMFIKFLLDHAERLEGWKTELGRLRVARMALAGKHEIGNRLAGHFAVLELAAAIAHEAFGFEWDYQRHLNSVWDDVMKEVGTADRPKAALESVLGWAVAQRHKFYDTGRNDHSSPYTGWSGRWDSGMICFVPIELDRFLRDLGHDPSAVQKTWADRGWVLKDKDGGNKRSRLDGPSVRMVTIQECTLEELFGPLDARD